MADLPPGFVLDRPQVVAPPPGFVLDGPDNRGAIVRTLNPRREDFPEYKLGPMDAGRENRFSVEDRALLSEFDRTNGDANARIGKDRYGNPTIITNRGTFYLERPGFDVQDVERAGAAVESFAKEAAPYLAGGAVTAPLRAGGAMLAQAGIGLTEESLDQADNAVRGGKVDFSRLATTPVFAAAGEGAARLAAHVLRPVFAKLVGSKAPNTLVKPDGSLTDDAIRALDDSMATPQQFDDLAAQELSRMRQTGQITAEQAERFNFFKSQGLEPTRAQVTRLADDFQIQQEAAKTSTGVRAALEGQEQQISRAFDTTIRGTGGNAAASGSPVADAVLNKASQLDAEISRLYKQVGDSLSPDKNIRLSRLMARLQGSQGDDQFTNGLVSSLRGYLDDIGVKAGTTGIVDASGNAASVSTVRGVNVQTAERIRQFLNTQYDSTTPYGRRLLRQFKDAIDEDVIRIAGDDAFAQARQAKAAFESGLRPESLSKFDTNDRSLVRNILENQIKADDVFQQAVLGKSWKASDLRELRNYLTRGSQQQTQTGLQAWSDLRAETVQWIKDQSFRSAADQAGNATMRTNSIRNSLDKIGPDRLSVLFSGEERTFLNNMVRLEQLRQPVPLTGNGRGPSAQAVQGLVEEVRRMANKLPGVGRLIEGLQNQSRAATTLSTPVRQTVDRAAATASRRAASGSGAAAGAAYEDRLMREN